MASGPVTFGTRPNGHMVIGGDTSEYAVYIDLGILDTNRRCLEAVVAIEYKDAKGVYVLKGELKLVPKDKANEVMDHCLEGEGPHDA